VRPPQPEGAPDRNRLKSPGQVWKRLATRQAASLCGAVWAVGPGGWAALSRDGGAWGKRLGSGWDSGCPKPLHSAFPMALGLASGIGSTRPCDRPDARPDQMPSTKPLTKPHSRP